MSDVKIGDKLLTIANSGKPTYSEVTMMIHQQSDTTVDDYIKLTTADGKYLVLSPYHLIPVALTDRFTDKTFIFAKDVRPLHHNLITYNHGNSSITISRTVGKEHVSALGMYAPLTRQGM